MKVETNPKPFVVECMYCHRVKSESGEYVAEETPDNAIVSHGLCPDCFRERYGEEEL